MKAGFQSAVDVHCTRSYIQGEDGRDNRNLLIGEMSEVTVYTTPVVPVDAPLGVA